MAARGAGTGSGTEAEGRQVVMVIPNEHKNIRNRDFRQNRDMLRPVLTRIYKKKKKHRSSIFFLFDLLTD